MAVIAATNTITGPKKTLLQPTISNYYSPGSKRTKKSKIPVIISINPSIIDLNDLSNLFKSCNHSPNRFPVLLTDGKVEPVNVGKLGVALTHSSVVVSAFCKHENDASGVGGGLRGGMWARVAPLAPVTPDNGRLVGFGRAVSDLGLTASIHDVMVLPSLRRMGIGRLIVQRILRMLKNRGVYDISALCSDNERDLPTLKKYPFVSSPFFEACGFGDDIMGATTMMYSKTAALLSTDSEEGDELVVTSGRKLLLAPPPRQTLYTRKPF